MQTRETKYPALLLRSLTPFYDLFASLFLPEKRIKRDLIAQARILPGHRVLDLGAGTGTLAIMVKKSEPGAFVTGIDGDPDVLTIARQKASRSGVEVVFETGSALTLPYPEYTFDRVLSTLVTSLLSTEQKTLAVREAYRVLQHGGELHIADFGPPHTWWGRFIVPRMRQFEPIQGNLDGILPVLFRDAGFASAGEAARYATLFGTISILSGQKEQEKRNYK